MRVADLLLLVLAQGVVGVAVRTHRAGPVERADRGDVLEVVRLHQPQQRPHRAAVELEHAERVTAAEQLEGRAVVQALGQLVQVQRDAAAGLDVLDRVVHDRQVAQAQEVHLDQAERLAARVVELGDDLAVLLAAHDRDQLDQRLAGHDHAGRVHTPLALQVLQAAGGVDDLADVLVGLVQLAELAGLGVPLVLRVEDAGQRHVLAHHRRRHRLGDPVAHRERVVQHPAGVLDRLLGLDRAVGDDHRDPVVAVLLGDVADHLGAAAVVEVDVEVGHRHALRVQEALEDQAVLERVQVGDPHRVRAHRTGTGTTARTDPDAVLLGPVDEVRDDQEVAGVPLRGDDLDLVLGLLADLVRDAAGVALVQAGLDLGDEPGLLVVALRAGEARHEPALALGEADVALLGDQQRVVTRLRQLLPHLAHLGRGLDVELVRVELEPVRVGQRRAGLDAEQRGVRGRVLGLGVVQVVGRDQRQAELAGQLQQVLLDVPLDAEAVVHQLAVEVLRAEDVAELRGGLDGLLVLPEPEPGLHLAATGSRWSRSGPGRRFAAARGPSGA